MEFHVRPVLEQMVGLYSIPRGQERFERYLFLLQGHSGGEMILPIAGYNPMGKEHVQERIQELIDMNAEEIMEANLMAINSKYITIEPKTTLEVVLNVSDDLGGAWTSKFASHYDHAFDFAAIATRNFSTPYLWTSDESYSEGLIVRRTLEAAYRTIYFLQKGKLKTLADHVLQETFVEQQIGSEAKVEKEALREIRKFYEAHKDSEDYNLIFNFLYGDEASTRLGYKAYGNREFAGFEFSRYNACKE